MVTFGMGISVPEEELDLCHELANVAYLNLGLTNDLYSWQKEYDTAVAMGQDYVVNIISVLMEEHNISEEEAKAICKEKIKVTIVDFRKIVKDTKERSDVSIETKRYLEAMLYSLSGNLVWSLECPRYHTWASYNERQLDWMKNGIPAKYKNPKNGATTTNGTKTNGTTTNGTTTNGTEMNGNGSVKPKSTKLTNGVNGTEPSSNGIDNSLVNVFATKKWDGLNGVKLYDEEPAVPSAGVKPRSDGEPQLSSEDLDMKVSCIQN